MSIRRTLAAAGSVLALFAGAGPAGAAQFAKAHRAGSGRAVAAARPVSAAQAAKNRAALATELAGATWVRVGRMLIVFPKSVPVRVPPSLEKKYGTTRPAAAPAALRPSRAMSAASACPVGSDACYGPDYMHQEYSGEVLDANDGSEPVLAGQVSGDTHQQWFFMATGGTGWYEVVNSWYGTVLTATDIASPGELVYGSPYSAGDTAQVWYIDANGEYHNGYTALCLDGDPNQGNTYQWTCDGNDTHEVWTL